MAHAHDLQVDLEQLELARERGLLVGPRIERGAQQVRQARDHAVRRLDVAVHLGRDRVQCVEQEVRMQLALQRLQVGFGEPRAQLRGRELAFLRLAMEVERVTEADDGPVGHHLPVEVQEEQLLEVHPPRDVTTGERLHDQHAAGHGERGMRHREDDDAAGMHGGGLLPRMPAEAIAPCHPQHARHEHRPRVPVSDVQREQNVERLLPVGEERDVVVGLQAREDPERRRDREDPQQADAPRGPIHE